MAVSCSQCSRPHCLYPPGPSCLRQRHRRHPQCQNGMVLNGDADLTRSQNSSMVNILKQSTHTRIKYVKARTHQSHIHASNIRTDAQSIMIDSSTSSHAHNSIFPVCVNPLSPWLCVNSLSTTTGWTNSFSMTISTFSHQRVDFFREADWHDWEKRHCFGTSDFSSLLAVI